MFEIYSSGFLWRRNRLVASAQLSKDDFKALASRLGVLPFRAGKIGMVAGRRAEHVEEVETRWNGKESIGTARVGDWIVTNLGPDASVLRDKAGQPNTYVITAEKFPALYERAHGGNEYGELYRSKGVVDAIFLSGGFEIIAPWGEKQTSPRGYLLLNGEEVYGNNEGTFDATYQRIS